MWPFKKSKKVKYTSYISFDPDHVYGNIEYFGLFQQYLINRFRNSGPDLFAWHIKTLNNTAYLQHTFFTMYSEFKKLGIKYHAGYQTLDNMDEYLKIFIDVTIGFKIKIDEHPNIEILTNV